MKIEGKRNWGVCVNLLGLVVGLLVAIVVQVSAQRSDRWTDGSLRLVGGRSKNEGTVLIYHWSRWGAICDDYWDIRDANVVCNELGYAGAKEALTRSRFGKGRREFFFVIIYDAMLSLNGISLFKVSNFRIASSLLNNATRV